MKKMVLIVLTLAIVVGAAIATHYTWVRIWGAFLTSDGHTVNNANVYRNWSGDILVDLRPVSGYLYIVRRSALTVGIPNASSIIKSRVVVLAKEYPLQVVDLRTEKGGRVDPKVILTSGKLSFIAADGKTIQVSW